MKNDPAHHRAVIKHYAKAIGYDCWQDLVSRCEPVAPRKKALKSSPAHGTSEMQFGTLHAPNGTSCVATAQLWMCLSASSSVRQSGD